MRTLMLAAAVALSMPLTAFAQEAASGQVQVRKQTANTAPQTVVETPATRQREAKDHLMDATNTRQGAPDPRPRDEHGTPKPEPIKGQGTDSSTDAQRAADKAAKEH